MHSQGNYLIIFKVSDVFVHIHYYFLNFLLITTSPSKPEPRSQTAAGMGTADIVMLSIIAEACPVVVLSENNS